MSRAYTVEEMQKIFLNHLEALNNYWARVDLTRPEFAQCLAEKGDALYRLEGLTHSILCVLDGVACGLPAFEVTPAPHSSDKEFHESEGKNWWPVDVGIHGGEYLHEAWSAKHRK